MALNSPAQSSTRAAAVRAALQSLSRADMARLYHFARIRCIGVASVDWEDLVQEAISRAIGGERAWPQGVPLIAFLLQCIRSIAFEASRKAQQTSSTVDTSGAELDLVAPGEVGDEISARQSLNAILALFSDDGAALAVLRGLALGETPDEICRRLEISLVEYQSTQRRIRRRIARLDVTELRC